MAELKSLTAREGISKLKDLAEGIGVCMFCTELTQLPISTRPMAVQEVDEYGNLWFISSSDSNKNFEIKEDNRVQLFFAKVSESTYLSVYGTATIYRDREKIEELWQPIAKAWFEEGSEDPKVTVIRVAASDAYYWDTKDGKLISLVKMAAAVIIGKGGDDGGIEGEIKI